MDHEAERTQDVSKILASGHIKKVIVAGPGTGKSFLFQAAIQQAKSEGKTRFRALTFIGKLCDALADDLAGLAETSTLHGFAREIMLGILPPAWEYYPRICEVIREDLGIKGVTEFEIGDENYQERTKYYQAIGDDDVVYYAVQVFKNDPNKIPIYDLVLVDEFQDFNELESEFIDHIASKNKVLIVGDDDQALYEFKGSSPRFIREKHHPSNGDFESHTLRFCSRCTEVIINSFHDVVGAYGLNDPNNQRIKKDYICYIPDKTKDSQANPKIVLFKNTAPGKIPIRIKVELEKILEEQKIKSALIIGEGRSCRTLLTNTGEKLKELGFKNVTIQGKKNHNFAFKTNVSEGYKILRKEKNPILAWRLLSEELDQQGWQGLIKDHYGHAAGFIAALPAQFKAEHEAASKTFKKIIEGTKSQRATIASSSVEKLKDKIVKENKDLQDIFLGELVEEHHNLPRPLGNLEIIVCNILNSKGLGADVVFLLGFDQGKIPARDTVEESEIYQMLVALTRAKKRIYFINTLSSSVSSFITAIKSENYEARDLG